MTKKWFQRHFFHPVLTISRYLALYPRVAVRKKPVKVGLTLSHFFFFWSICEQQLFRDVNDLLMSRKGAGGLGGRLPKTDDHLSML